MKRTIIKLMGVLLIGLLFVSCAGVKFEYDSPGYLEMQLKELPPELLSSKIVLNEEGQTLLDNPITVAEFVVYMMSAQPLERHTWFTANVVPGDEGSTITLKQYVRGDLTLVNTLKLTYQNDMSQSRVDSITWDDKRFDEKVELITLEEKAEYAALVLIYFLIQ